MKPGRRFPSGGGVFRVVGGLTVLAMVGLVLASGSATRALWNAGVTVSELKIESGDLNLRKCKGFKPSWHEAGKVAVDPTPSSTDFSLLASYDAMPGDVIVMDYCVEAHLKGDNLAVAFTLDWILDGANLADYDSLNVSLTDDETGWTLVESVAPPGFSSPAPVASAIGSPSAFRVVSALDWSSGLSADRTFQWLISVTVTFKPLAPNPGGQTPPAVLPLPADPVTGTPTTRQMLVVPRMVLRAEQIRDNRLGSGFN